MRNIRELIQPEAGSEELFERKFCLSKCLVNTGFVRPARNAYILHQLNMLILMHGGRVSNPKNIEIARYSINFCDLRPVRLA